MIFKYQNISKLKEKSKFQIPPPLRMTICVISAVQTLIFQSVHKSTFKQQDLFFYEMVFYKKFRKHCLHLS